MKYISAHLTFWKEEHKSQSEMRSQSCMIEKEIHSKFARETRNILMLNFGNKGSIELQLKSPSCLLKVPKLKTNYIFLGAVTNQDRKKMNKKWECHWWKMEKQLKKPLDCDLQNIFGFEAKEDKIEGIVSIQE